MERTGTPLWARIATIVAAVVLVVLAQNVALAVFFPDLQRLPSDFSPAYFERDLARAAAPGQTLFLGDSVLWGYRLGAAEPAVSLLEARGCRCRNLALKGGSAVNFYVISRLLRGARAHDIRVVIEINQKSFNKLDPSYKTIHPSLAALAGSLLDAKERVRLSAAPPAPGLAGSADRAFARISGVYAMRADLRATFFGDDDGSDAPPASTSPDDYLGMYDMRPLGPDNAAVAYLTRTLDTFRADGVPVLAFLTPTNHGLLHEFVDRPEYAANRAYLRTLVTAHGAAVLDLDSAFAASEFFDNAHLRPAGQRHLATILGRALSSGTFGNAPR